MTAQPADIGMHVNDVDTPALLIDLDAFESNLQSMAVMTSQAGVKLRAHSKTHKSPVIALKQVALGAVGVCCQKVSEAEVMVHGGVKDVLITNEIVGRRKIERLMALSRHAAIAVCVDNLENIHALSQVASSYATNLNVLVEIDVGAHRCGSAPGEPAYTLAQAVHDAHGLRFAGLQAYHGPAQHFRSYEERRIAVEEATKLTRATRDLLRERGLICDIIGGAGTGTFHFEAASHVYNEVQAGSYIFMDADYAKNYGRNGGPFQEFPHSLFILATVMSVPNSTVAVLDAGLKAVSVDSGMPTVYGIEGVTYIGASDEHGKIVFADTSRPLALGEKIKLIPGHCDPTVNLYDWFVGIRNDRVEALWPIAARGPGY